MELALALLALLPFAALVVRLRGPAESEEEQLGALRGDTLGRDLFEREA